MNVGERIPGIISILTSSPSFTIRTLELIELIKQRAEQYQSYYTGRQAIVEHPYGTIKRRWEFNYIITKESIERASADV